MIQLNNRQTYNMVTEGGENRRMLLELKCVLEEVQSGVKREESKRGELELQYTQDRCAWELERSELKSRITQLEARGCSVVVESVRSPELGDTLKRERAEQKKLLADTHSAAMDLRCRLENSERGWMKEKSELLERFESERKEWENQLMDMQRKIEELYSEVKAHRTGISLRPITDGQIALRLSSCSASTLSSAVTNPSDGQSFEYSEPLTQQSNASIDSQQSQLSRNASESSELCNNDQIEEQSVAEQQAIDTADLEEILESCLKEKVGKKSWLTGQDVLLNPFRRFQSMEISCGSDKKKNNTSLNAALNEIARASEELCSYQDEKRKLADIKRSRSESAFFQRETELVERVKDHLEMEDTVLYLKNMSEDLKSIDEQYWMNWECCNMHISDDKPKQEDIRQAPPIPIRSTSWYISSPSASELESSVTEQRSGTHPDRKYTSPAIVRKFEAMLQENEGKILTDSGNTACIVPTDINCCQSRWSCDASRFGSNKSSRDIPVKRCLSNADIADADHSVNQSDAENLNDLKSASHLTNISSLDSPKNERLEQKTAEFNRTLFQAGMGLRCDEDIGMNAPTDCSPSLISEDTFTDSPLSYVEDNLELSDLVQPCPEDKGRKTETKDRFSMPLSLQQECGEIKPLQTERTTPILSDKQCKSASSPQIQTERVQEDKKSTCSTRSRILDENPWKPSTLAAYPRPVESRSNYGAVERILKSYEERSQQPSPGKKEDLMDLLEMLDKRPEPESTQRLTHTPHHKETLVKVQQCKESSVTNKKSFSRPACPAKRRLPSRWASRSSISSASSPSPPPTPTPPPPTVFTQRQTLAYSTFHTETVI